MPKGWYGINAPVLGINAAVAGKVTGFKDYGAVRYEAA
jgi:hypothetical protein